MRKLEHHGFQMMHPFSQTLAKCVCSLCRFSDKLGFRFCLNWFSRLSLNHCFWHHWWSISAEHMGKVLLLYAFKLYSFGRETACEICWYSSSIWFHTWGAVLETSVKTFDLSIKGELMDAICLIVEKLCDVQFHLDLIVDLWGDIIKLQSIKKLTILWSINLIYTSCFWKLKVCFHSLLDLVFSVKLK